MTEMIERVAEGIYWANAHCYAERRVVPWFELDENSEAKKKHRFMARQAIALMREPTEGMSLAGLVALGKEIYRLSPPLRKIEDGEILSNSEAAQRYMTIGAGMRCSSEVNEAFKAMIDAALGEKK